MQHELIFNFTKNIKNFVKLPQHESIFSKDYVILCNNSKMNVFFTKKFVKSHINSS